MRSLDNEKNKKFVLPVFVLVIGFDCVFGDRSVDKVGSVGSVAINVVFEERIEHNDINQF